ncbi:hypothetical protein AKJ35_00060 [candidate division MSBL1 archaeon SCGC-AAA833F18]|uniref:Transcription regulator AsnC/Lrp ligand binding domain-containing protein n=2 Tax=candidate division MSBL1 TaxID=215777 RepID=A0A133VTC5_9EURY|nr:hypothetical protein AKJ47_03075 [candidate division MSBL1 archaeon SCGC-AAA261G05]KXB09692.1 hypothetical protein AKJ35_00060 [candidate division MSBL1 archaeon SCGC-AAA833F18]
MEDAYKEVKAQKRVREAQMITGPYDIMAIAEADDITGVTDVLMTKIREIDGIEDTTTCIFIE